MNEDEFREAMLEMRKAEINHDNLIRKIVKRAEDAEAERGHYAQLIEDVFGKDCFTCKCNALTHCKFNSEKVAMGPGKRRTDCPYVLMQKVWGRLKGGKDGE